MIIMMIWTKYMIKLKMKKTDKIIMTDIKVKKISNKYMFSTLWTNIRI